MPAVELGLMMLKQAFIGLGAVYGLKLINVLFLK